MDVGRSSHGLLSVLPQSLPEGAEENHEDS
jgi:hypothetical protein